MKNPTPTAHQSGNGRHHGAHFSGNVPPPPLLLIGLAVIETIAEVVREVGGGDRAAHSGKPDRRAWQERHHREPGPAERRAGNGDRLRAAAQHRNGSGGLDTFSLAPDTDADALYASGDVTYELRALNVRETSTRPGYAGVEASGVRG